MIQASVDVSLRDVQQPQGAYGLGEANKDIHRECRRRPVLSRCQFPIEFTQFHVWLASATQPAFGRGVLPGSLRLGTGRSWPKAYSPLGKAASYPHLTPWVDAPLSIVRWLLSNV